MSRLDRHVGMVRSKLTLGRFFEILGSALLLVFVAAFVVVVVDRLTRYALPRQWTFFWAALGVAALVSFVLAFIRRPTEHQAAVAIDEKLGLKEKFSTALYVRNTGDPFAVAAVRDAERTADNVSLYKRFPLQFPRSGGYALGGLVVLALTAWLLPQMDLFGREAARARLAQNQATVEQAKQDVQQKVKAIAAMSKAFKASPAVQQAKKDIAAIADRANADPVQMKESAFNAMEEAKKAVEEEIKDSQQYAEAKSDRKLFSELNPSLKDTGPVSEAKRDLASGDFAKAAEKLGSLGQKFDKMSETEKEKTAQDMTQLAKQLQQIANNPAAMKNLQNQLQQAGVNQQTAQQIASAANQAAQGNPQALQKMQQQAMQQMNNGKGATQQQQQQISQLMKQMQAAASAQQNAAQMQGAAQQMASAMQQAAAGTQQGTGQKGSQQQGGHQAGSQQSGSQQGSQQAGGGQQPGSQQAGGGQQPGQQPGQGPGQQPGQQPSQGQGGQTPGQQMANAQDQMKQALDKMDAVQKDAEEQAAAANAGNQPGQNPGDQGNGNGDGDKGGNGQWAAGNPQGKGVGHGGPGAGGGVGGSVTEAPFQFKQEIVSGAANPNGRIIASTLVKSDPLHGESKIQISKATAAAVKDATNDVDEESVPKEAQGAVKKYFDSMDGK